MSLPNKTWREVKFSSDGGKFFVHNSLLSDCDETHQDCDKKHEIDLPSPLPPDGQPSISLEDDPSCYVWRSQDYSFLPVKTPHQVNQTLCSYSKKLAKLRRHSSRVHFAKIHFGIILKFGPNSYFDQNSEIWPKF